LECQIRDEQEAEAVYREAAWVAREKYSDTHWLDNLEQIARDEGKHRRWLMEIVEQMKV
jgi:rubrerythrin